MLDRMFNAIVKKMGGYAAAVNAQRAKIERERASDEARDHAGREFVNPEGFTTPLPKNAQNKQNEYARARRDFEKANVPGALAATVALMVARERRDEANAALKMHLAAEALRMKEGVHPEVKPFFNDMFEMGVEPRRLPYVRVETLAIMCDMIMWDGQDPDMNDPDSPMPAIFELYASRLILTPGQFHDRSRSKPGVPARKVRYTDPEYYMFGDLLQPTEDGAAGEEVAAPGPTDEQRQQLPTLDEDEPQSEPEATPDDTPHILPIKLKAKPEIAYSIPADLALRVAQAVVTDDSSRLRIYWPKGGHPIGDYDTTRLIPALEKSIETDPWQGWQDFLAAARTGQGREFIDSKRRASVKWFADDLRRGDERALTDARAAGFAL